VIFNIGLPKTGTTSICRALNILGYKCVHDFVDVSLELLKCNNKDSFIDASKKYNSFSGGMSICYKQLDELFPDSKFILSTRELESWIKSCSRWFRRISNSEIRKAIFKGHTRFNNEIFVEVYNEHIANVKKYFKGRDILIFDIEKDGWNELCGFLNKELPNRGFPHENINSR
jgi:hypothetical protein